MFSKWNVRVACRKFESRLEGYLSGAADPELKEHLALCAACRAALEDSHVAGDLVRTALRPAIVPGDAFATGVMAKIRREQARRESGAAFWAPLEFLASRLSLTAAMVLLVLSGYLVEFAPRRNSAPLPMRTELSTNDFPQPPGDPVSNEEVLQSLAERAYGR